MIAGLAIGLGICVLQAGALFAFARRFPDAWYLAIAFAVVLAAPFLAALLLLDGADEQLGLLTGQLALIAAGPEIAQRTRRGNAPERRLRHAAIVLRAVQLLSLACALYAWLVLEDLQAAAPMVVAILALQRCHRYVRKTARAGVDP